MAYRSRYSSSYGRRRSRRNFLGWLVAGLAVVGGGVAAWWAGWFGPVLARVPGLASAPAASGTAAPVAAGATPATSAPAGAPAPAATAAPSATPTPPETAGAVGRRYLEAWQAGDYAAMYALLSTAAQARIGREVFVNRYTAIKEEAGIAKVTATPAAGVPDNASSLPYTATIEMRVGTVTEQQALPLVQADGRWGVDWQPTLIFKELKGERLVRFFPENPIRGRILDRHGTVLAETGEAPIVGVIPADIKDEAALLAGLSQRFGMEPEAIKKKYSGGRPDWFMPIKRLSWTTQEPELVAIQKIADGVQVRMYPERQYPLNHLASHIVGYATEVQAEDLPKGHQPGDRVGRTGLEAAAEKELAGERGGRLLIVEKDGTPAVTLAQRKARPGADVTLTLDLTIQRTAEAALGDKRGAVVVLDPKDGAVLAMASKPTFDPNEFILGFSDEAWAALNDPKLRPLTNRTVDGVYPPGSIFKVVTMSAAMEKLGMPRTEQFSCAGSFKLPKAPQVWADWKPGGHGRLHLVEGLTTSCDIVFYTIGQRLDAVEDDGSPLAEMTRAFGLGKPTGIAELPEAAGNVPDEAWKMKTFNDVWATGDTINFAIGQGFLLDDAAPDGRHLRRDRQWRGALDALLDLAGDAAGRAGRAHGRAEGARPVADPAEHAGGAEGWAERRAEPAGRHRLSGLQGLRRSAGRRQDRHCRDGGEGCHPRLVRQLLPAGRPEAGRRLAGGGRSRHRGRGLARRRADRPRDLRSASHGAGAADAGPEASCSGRKAATHAGAQAVGDLRRPPADGDSEETISRRCGGASAGHNRRGCTRPGGRARRRRRGHGSARSSRRRTAPGPRRSRA